MGWKVNPVSPRKIGALLLLATLMLTALAVPTVGMTTGDGDELRIVCATSILADFTMNVVGDLARVDYLMPAGVCPSHYDARPSDATRPA